MERPAGQKTPKLLANKNGASLSARIEQSSAGPGQKNDRIERSPTGPGDRLPRRSLEKPYSLTMNSRTSRPAVCIGLRDTPTKRKGNKTKENTKRTRMRQAAAQLQAKGSLSPSSSRSRAASGNVTERPPTASASSQTRWAPARGTSGSARSSPARPGKRTAPSSRQARSQQVPLQPLP